VFPFGLKFRKSFQSVLVYTLTLLIALIMSFPVFWMISLSIRPLGETFVPTLLPSGIELQAYIKILTNPSLRIPFANSMLVATSSTLLALVLGLPTAYGLSRYRFRGSNLVLMFIIGNRMFPPVLLTVSYFFLVTRVKLYDSLLAVILMDTVITLPFAVWMMRNYFDTVPPELDEAAIVDGTTRLGALLRVVLPVSTPGMAATAVYCFLLAWNEFLFAFTFTQSEENQVTSIKIASLQGQFWTDWPTLLSYSVLFIIPIVILFLVMQRYLVQGLAAGSTKG
jgi:multiple sugar transport system permease protein